MKNILLFDTSIATLNMGDEIINVSIRKNMEDVLRKNYYVTMPSHTLLYSKMQNIICNKKMNVYNKADYKFLCGTNALYTNMFRPLPNWNIGLFNTQIVKDTILLGVGIGENSKNINVYTKMLYNKVLSKNFIHSTRDEKTKKMLEKLGFKASNTGCPTLWGLTPEFCANIPKEKAENAIFTLTHYIKDKTNDKEMIKILRKNYKKLYFWPQSIKDLDYLKELGEEENINIVSPNLMSYEEILSEGVDYIGNRLHGGVFALQNRCRSIIIAIDYRAKEMNKNYSIPCIERENILDKLEELICSEWETRIDGLDFEKIKQWKSQFI